MVAMYLNGWVCIWFAVANPFYVPGCLVCCCQPTYCTLYGGILAIQDTVANPFTLWAIFDTVCQSICLKEGWQHQNSTKLNSENLERNILSNLSKIEMKMLLKKWCQPIVNSSVKEGSVRGT